MDGKALSAGGFVLACQVELKEGAQKWGALHQQTWKSRLQIIKAVFLCLSLVLDQNLYAPLF
jgi:hypothetical protein